MPEKVLANLILIVHFSWALWMLAGIILAFWGFYRPRVWEWKKFRITHLIALAGTATTPLWAEGICPLTTWEWKLRTAAGYTGSSGPPESFIIHWLRELLFWDVDPTALALVTGSLALATVVIFFLRPPWRQYTRGKSTAP